MPNESPSSERPIVALTMGDVAGIGPELVARACCDRQVAGWCRPIVVGHPRVLTRAAELVRARFNIVAVDQVADAVEKVRADRDGGESIVCLNPAGDEAASVEPGALDARAGRAAYQYAKAAAEAALGGHVDAMATAPLNKMALRRAGCASPGHTEMLAELCGVDDFAMMLFLPGNSAHEVAQSRQGAREVKSLHGLGVAHVTLHTSLASVPSLISAAAVQEKITLLARFMRDVGCPSPRIAVCALNPHAGEGGLFGEEEGHLIAPAVAAARESGIDVTGPLPADTLLMRAVGGAFDGVVAMYHDQGHIALKLIGFDRAVNVTLGLPIIRTSPIHGTAFDIAWRGKAQADGLLQATRVASLLARRVES